MTNTGTMGARTVYIDDVIGTAKVNKFHIFYFLILLFTHFVNGYGVNIYSVVVKDMVAEIGMDTVMTGLLGSTVFYGMIVGAMLAGYVATKIGFKKTAIVFGTINIITYIVMGATDSVAVFAVMRTLSGVGLSGVMPCTSGTMAEWAPVSMRGFFVTCVTLGTSLGSAFCSAAAIGIKSIIGWRGMFFIEAMMLICILLIMFVIPESLQMLVKKGKNSQIYKNLKRMNPAFEMSESDEFRYKPVNTMEKANFIELFKNGHARNTICLFLSKAMIFFTNFGLQSWFTTLMAQTGYSDADALLALTVFNLGGMIGMPLIGLLARRFGYKKSLIPIFLIMTASVAMLGFYFPIAILFALMLITGICVCCIIGGEIPYAQDVFPLPLRPLILGVVLGLTRIGASLGPTVGGIVLAANPGQTLYFVYAAGVIASMVFLLLIKDNSAKYETIPQARIQSKK